MSNNSILPRDRTLSGPTTPGQSEPGSNGNKGVLWIPQSSSMREASPSDYFMSYPGQSLVGVLLLCRDAVNLTASADWAISKLDCLWFYQWKWNKNQNYILIKYIELTFLKSNSFAQHFLKGMEPYLLPILSCG